MPPNWEVNATAVKEMHRQVGGLELDEDGLARRGLLVRHLVLPDDLAGTDRVLGFIAREVSPDTYVNVMGQYQHVLPRLYPPVQYRAPGYLPMDRVPVEGT